MCIRDRLGGGRHVDDECGGHAATGAHGGDPGATALPAELVDQGDDHAGPGGGDGMPEAAAAPEHVHKRVVDAEDPGGGHAHGGKGFIDLPQVDVRDVDSGPGQRL